MSVTSSHIARYRLGHRLEWTMLLKIRSKLLLYTILLAILWHLHFGQTFVFKPYCTPSNSSQFAPWLIELKSPLSFWLARGAAAGGSAWPGGGVKAKRQASSFLAKGRSWDAKWSELSSNIHERGTALPGRKQCTFAGCSSVQQIWILFPPKTCCPCQLCFQSHQLKTSAKAWNRCDRSDSGHEI